MSQTPTQLLAELKGAIQRETGDITFKVEHVYNIMLSYHVELLEAKRFQSTLKNRNQIDKDINTLKTRGAK